MRSSWNGLYILDMFMSIQDVQFLAFNTENVACFALKCIRQSLSHFSRFLGPQWTTHISNEANNMRMPGKEDGCLIYLCLKVLYMFTF
jgi:hypothetical protein